MCSNLTILLILSCILIMSGESSDFGKLSQQKSIFEDGPDDDCVCIELYDPVCGSDGITYSNACFLACARKTKKFVFGLCEGECPCCKEPYYNNPVGQEHVGFWGWDRMTGAPHQMLISDEKIDSKNCNRTVLVSNCVCPKHYKPVCGSDGKNYGNACVLACQQKWRPCLMQACEGECPCCPGSCPEASKITALRT